MNPLNDGTGRFEKRRIAFRMRDDRYYAPGQYPEKQLAEQVRVKEIRKLHEQVVLPIDRKLPRLFLKLLDVVKREMEITT